MIWDIPLHLLSTITVLIYQLSIYEGRDQEFELAHADHSINPLPTDIYYLYKKWRVDKHGKENGEDMFKQLQHTVDNYNKEHKQEDGKAFLQSYEGKISKGTQETTGQPLVLAVCTPLMARAHQLVRQAGELVYRDSTASLDRHNCPTFVISTCTSAGGIPLGVVITSGESEAVITEAVTFLKNILPCNAFYGRGFKGPEVCITDDCDAERAALRNTWPDTTLLLCIFHYIQCWWTWLWNADHGIAKEDRQPIIEIVKKKVYTPYECDLEQRYDEVMKCNPTQLHCQLFKTC